MTYSDSERLITICQVTNYLKHNNFIEQNGSEVYIDTLFVMESLKIIYFNIENKTIYEMYLLLEKKRLMDHISVCYRLITNPHTSRFGMNWYSEKEIFRMKNADLSYIILVIRRSLSFLKK